MHHACITITAVMGFNLSAYFQAFPRLDQKPKILKLPDNMI